MLDGKKTLFSGMQATGNLTLGNYLGALKNWVTISDEYQTFFSVVDMHSITVRQDPAELRKRARTLLTLYIAAGLDPEKNCIYYQSHVSGHAELAWILNCFYPMRFCFLYFCHWCSERSCFCWMNLLCSCCLYCLNL